MKIKMKSSIKKMSALLTMMAVAILALPSPLSVAERPPKPVEKFLNPVPGNVFARGG